MSLRSRARQARRTTRRWRNAARTRWRRPEIPDFPLPEVVPARPVTAAVILDPFSELAFGYEWRQVTFGPDDWRQVLATSMPDLLFVESAWQGNNGQWRLHLTEQPSEELRALVSWCRDAGIPTVFWNKEDPPNYDLFLETAKLFDQVFTVDADRIPHYQRDLGHDRVDLLPFAAQPRLHNPVQRGPVQRGPVRRSPGREYDVAFAGTWFADKHASRREQLELLLTPARDHGLHIWSRLQNEDRRYRFPHRYRQHVVGSLPYERMLGAYTSYKLFLNVNSVTTSKTMCSRRLFELSAAQTPVVTTPAASVEPFFGADVEVVRDEAEARAAIEVLLAHEDLRDRMALRAHRRVYDEHLVTHRVDTVLRAIDRDTPVATPTVSAIVPTIRPGQLDHVLRQVGTQTWPHLQLVLVLHGIDVPPDLEARARDAGVTDLVVRRADADVTLGAALNLGVQAADGQLVAKLDDDNLYLPDYLTDLVRALDYSGADVAGKWAHFVHLEASRLNLLRFAEHEHRFTDLVQGGTLLTGRDLAAELRFEDLPRRVDTTFLHKVRRGGGTVYSADRFNFVSVRRADPAGHTWHVTERDLLRRSSRLLFHGAPHPHAEA
jgi:spore maturation protein CgeB